MQPRRSLTAQLDLVAEPWAETGPLRVRMGVHCGQAEQRARRLLRPDRQPDGPDHGRGARRPGPPLRRGRRPWPPSSCRPAPTSSTSASTASRTSVARSTCSSSSTPSLPSAVPALVTVRAAGVDLPARVAALVGRRDELAEIAAPPRGWLGPPAHADRAGGHRQDDARDPDAPRTWPPLPGRRVLRRPVRRPGHERRARRDRPRCRPRRDHRPAPGGGTGRRACGTGGC